MAKLDSPFGSKKVSGRIGDGFVMSSWRGIPYIRQFVVPAYRSSERLDKVRDLFARQNRRWMGLREAQREAWRLFCEKKRILGQPNVIFASYSSLALDAGLPEPVLPPKSGKPQPPRLTLQLEGDLLSVSWDVSRLIEAQRRSRSIGTPHALRLTAVLDLWYWSGRSSLNPHPHFHKHLVYLPLSAGKFLFQPKKPRFVSGLRSQASGIKYSYRARVVLPDSNHSRFSAATLIRE
jgi:hypothetical protein